jgi:hypothetical protein
MRDCPIIVTITTDVMPASAPISTSPFSSVSHDDANPADARVSAASSAVIIGAGLSFSAV